MQYNALDMEGNKDKMMETTNEERLSVQYMYRHLGISDKVYHFSKEILDQLQPRFEEIDRTAEYNQLKVLKAMQDNKVSEACLLGTTGYGYNDLGRETLEAVYASLFHTEDALVRPQITCGTHALALALMSNLRPGDELLSPVGKPYDTLEEVIGIRPSKGSLAEYGISYRQVDLLSDGSFDYENIRKAVNEQTKLVTIQRSKGYQTRPTLSAARIGELISFIKASPACDRARAASSPRVRGQLLRGVCGVYGTDRRRRGHGGRLADQKSRRRIGADWRLYRGKEGVC